MKNKIEKLIKKYEGEMEEKQKKVNHYYDEYPDLRYDLENLYERDGEKRQNDLEIFESLYYFRGSVQGVNYLLYELKELLNEEVK